MSEKKWREDFEMLFPIPVLVLRYEHAYVPKTKGIASVKNAEYFNIRYNTFLAAKRQDAERIVELRGLLSESQTGFPLRPGLNARITKALEELK